VTADTVGVARRGRSGAGDWSIVRALVVADGRVAVDLPWTWEVIAQEDGLTSVGPPDGRSLLRFLWIDAAAPTRDASVHAAGHAVMRATLVGVLGRGAVLRTLDDGDLIGSAARRRQGRLWARGFVRNRREAGFLLVTLWNGRRGDAARVDATLAAARRLSCGSTRI